MITTWDAHPKQVVDGGALGMPTIVSPKWEMKDLAMEQLGPVPNWMGPLSVLAIPPCSTTKEMVRLINVLRLLDASIQP